MTPDRSTVRRKTTIRMLGKWKLLLGAVIFAVWAGTAPAKTEAKPASILIELSPMQTSAIFGCRIPVTVHYSGPPALTWANAQARAYRGKELIGSSDVDTARDPLLQEEAAASVKYDTAPIQFGLTPELCHAVTQIDIVEANCSFDNGPAQDCLDRLRLSAPPGSKLEFAIGVPAVGRTVLSSKSDIKGLGG